MQHTFFQAQGKTSELVTLQCRIKVYGLHRQKWDYIMLTMMKKYPVGRTSQPLSSQSQEECDRILRERPYCPGKFGADVAYPQPHLLHASPVRFQTILATVPETRTPFLP